MCLLHPSKTDSHGPQGMDEDGCARWLGDHPWPTTPAAQWPRASVQNRHPTQQVRQRGPRQDGPQRQSGTKPAAGHVPPLREASRPPEAVAEDAVVEVQRLEAAIAVLGESNPHARPLKDALQATKSRSRVPPVAERIEVCKTFLERAKRRVVRAEEIIKRAVEQKDVHVAEVEDAERRLLQKRGSPHARVSEVGELKRQIDELVQERDQLRQTVCKGVPKQLQGEWFSDGATELAKVLPMPSDLQDWKGGWQTGIASCAMLWSSAMLR